MCGKNILKERNAGRLRKMDVRVEGCGIVIKGRQVGMTVIHVPRMTERTTEKLLFLFLFLSQQNGMNFGFQKLKGMNY